mmetsp:Transcript_14431/g.35816  ORF Transcript_14431/g.35816 Transcript_14431/m.35816 type:complete len:283 (-) Transcript_14431:420-1268(-)
MCHHQCHQIIISNYTGWRSLSMPTMATSPKAQGPRSSHESGHAPRTVAQRRTAAKPQAGPRAQASYARHSLSPTPASDSAEQQQAPQPASQVPVTCTAAPATLLHCFTASQRNSQQGQKSQKKVGRCRGFFLGGSRCTRPVLYTFTRYSASPSKLFCQCSLLRAMVFEKVTGAAAASPLLLPAACCPCSAPLLPLLLAAACCARVARATSSLHCHSTMALCASYALVMTARHPRYTRKRSAGGIALKRVCCTRNQTVENSVHLFSYHVTSNEFRLNLSCQNT